jgi:hypothetical protein
MTLWKQHVILPLSEFYRNVSKDIVLYHFNVNANVYLSEYLFYSSGGMLFKYLLQNWLTTLN